LLRLCSRPARILNELVPGYSHRHGGVRAARVLRGSHHFSEAPDSCTGVRRRQPDRGLQHRADRQARSSWRDQGARVADVDGESIRPGVRSERAAIAHWQYQWESNGLPGAAHPYDLSWRRLSNPGEDGARDCTVQSGRTGGRYLGKVWEKSGKTLATEAALLRKPLSRHRAGVGIGEELPDE
jgi:hypothetical protein